MKMFHQILMFSWMLICSSSVCNCLFAKTVVNVSDFRWEPLSTGEIRFIPLCKDADGDTSHDCDTWELDMHLFEWQFSETDFSLEPTPIRRFRHDIDKVVLRVSGIKQLDDPDERGPRVAPECLPPICKRTNAEPIVKYAGILGDLSALPSDPFPASFGEFGRPPVPNDTFTIPIILVGNHECDMQMQVKLKCSIDSAPMEVVCYRPGCGADFDVSDFTLDIRKDETVTMLARTKIPGDMALGDALKLEMIASSRFSDEECSVQFMDTVVSILPIKQSIDPNKKELLNGPIFHQGNTREHARYRISFENRGGTPETKVTVRDTLDNRFDFANLKIESVKVKGVPIIKYTGSSGRIPASEFPMSYYKIKSGDKDFQIVITLRGKDKIAKWEGGEVIFTVPLKTSPILKKIPEFSPAICNEKICDSTCVPIPNRAWTSFGSEKTLSKVAVWHLCESDTQACVIPRRRRPSEGYIVRRLPK